MLKITIILLVIGKICGLENVVVESHENIVLHTTTQQTQDYHPNYINEEEESARQFLQLYDSVEPVVLLIDNSQQSQNHAYEFIKNVYKLDRKNKIRSINFMIMKFNASGVSKILETTQNNKVRFEQVLKQPALRDPSNFLGRENFNKSAVFFGILNAVQVLPAYGGIVVFMKGAIEDEVLAQHAWVQVHTKRIQVFVVWGGTNDEKLLKELAINSHGAFVLSSGKDISQVYYKQFLENIGAFKSVSTILSRRNLRGENNLNFPIDSDVTGIHISITPNITRGILTTPRGYNIDVSGNEDITRYSAGSFVNREDEMYDIHVNTTTATTQDVGVWHFRVANARALYNITIFVHTKLTTNATVVIRNLTDVNRTGNRKQFLKLSLTGDVSSISNISFIDKDGNPILSNVKYTLDKNWNNYLTENIENMESNQKREVDIDVETIPKDLLYAVISGKDSQGHNFTRLSYVTGSIKKDLFYLPPLTVEVGLGSEVITQPFRKPQLFFDVTNNGNTPTLTRFFCRDDKGLLLAMNPWYKWINPQETSTVRVTLTTRPGSYQDFITFTAVAGSETIAKKVIVDVGNHKHDGTDPELDYHFTSDCSSVIFGSCVDGTWTIEVKAKDSGSGLLQVISRPKGIYFPNGFTTGTTEEVTGIFSESCCNPDLELVAFDRHHNQRTRHLNAYNAALGPGAIAAIVLGILLIIIIIIVIVLLYRKYCVWGGLQRSGSYNLPVYRGPLSSRKTEI